MIKFSFSGFIKLISQMDDLFHAIWIQMMIPVNNLDDFFKPQEFILLYPTERVALKMGDYYFNQILYGSHLVFISAVAFGEPNCATSEKCIDFLQKHQISFVLADGETGSDLNA